MKFTFPLTLVLSLLLQSCNGQPNPEITTAPPSTQETLSDTLLFTSGIGAILHDSHENYWFGSLQEGLARMDGDTIQYYTTADGLAGMQVRSIQEGPEGYIYFGTINGVSRYDGENLSTLTPIEGGELTGDQMVSADALWFNAGINEGVYRYLNGELKYFSFPIPEDATTRNVYQTTGTTKDINDAAWIATYAGVFGVENKELILLYDQSLNLNIVTGLLHVRSILADSKGRVWIGNNGMGVLLVENDTTINFSQENNLMHPNSSRVAGNPNPRPGSLQQVFTIAEDLEGNIWFGDSKTGVWKYDGESVHNYTELSGLENTFALAIHTDRNDKMWFGMGDGSVYHFNGERFVRVL